MFDQGLASPIREWIALFDVFDFEELLALGFEVDPESAVAFGGLSRVADDEDVIRGVSVLGVVSVVDSGILLSVKLPGFIRPLLERLCGVPIREEDSNSPLPRFDSLDCIVELVEAISVGGDLVREGH